ncbi:Protein of unknown function DUF3468 [Paramyrothecium foliicola]|nr:Protein of unknown function DUF3468 [Paramyrothecium foliicola]
MSTTRFAFVDWKPLSQRSAAENTLIRRHCMKGKNKRADSRRSRKEVKIAELTTTHEIAAAGAEEPRAGRFAECLWRLQYRSGLPVEVRSLPMLVQVDHRMSGMATKVKRSPRGLLNECKLHIFICKTMLDVWILVTIYHRITEVTDVLETLIDFNLPANRPELPPLDETMVHGILLINSAVHDFSQKRAFTDMSAPILARTLTLLAQKLATPEAFLQITTVYTVAHLAAVATSIGDIAAIQTHMTGLHKIITLRGGPQSLWPWSKMQVKLESLDLVLALSLGSEPFFLRDPPGYWDPSLPGTTRLPSAAHSLGSCSFQPLNQNLHSVFLDLADLISVANQHFNVKQKVNVTLYHPRIHAVSSRLLVLERTFNNNLDACLCIGMLCFVVSLFQTPFKYPTYAYVTKRLQNTVQALRDSQQLPPQPIIRWVLILASISILDPTDHWLHETWAATVEPGLGWLEVRQRLREVLWIDKIHDNLGRAVFTMLTRRK